MEILFRGFNPYENGTKTITIDGKQIKGEWVKGDLLHDKKSGKFYIFGHTKSLLDYVINLNICEVLPETVGQYTNLTDKNGTRIFDGDIAVPVWVSPSGTIDGLDEDLKGVVEYKYGEYVCTPRYERCWKLTNFIKKVFKEYRENVGEICEPINNIVLCEVIGTKWDNPEMEEK